jgi:hypothetical protein
MFHFVSETKHFVLLIITVLLQNIWVLCQYRCLRSREQTLSINQYMSFAVTEQYTSSIHTPRQETKTRDINNHKITTHLEKHTITIRPYTS